jgi:glutamyl/glutaminyl-tRNA synthetase
MHAPSSLPSGPGLLSRIAPTPSGYLHRGNGFSFVLSWLLMRVAGGRLLLRIDDADTSRARPEFIEDIFYSLEWLGLDWDVGPAGPDDFHKNYSQALRFAYYEQLLAALARGGRVYACRCSRSQIKALYADGIYRGSCRSKAYPLAEAEQAWRIRVAEGDSCFQEAGTGLRCLPLARQMGDFVVRRREGLPAYQLASLADDLFWGVNYIVRGEDLLYSTAAQVFLAQELSGIASDGTLQQQANAFSKTPFLHHPLLLDEQGQKLSKSAGSTALKSLREAGGTPLPIYAQVADYLQLPADAAASLPALVLAARHSSRVALLLS